MGAPHVPSSISLPTLLSGLVLIGSLGACSAEPSKTREVALGSPVLNASPETLTTYRVEAPRADIAERARKLAEVVLGSNVAELGPEDMGRGDGSLVWSRVGSVDGVMAMYQADLDDLEVKNVALETNYSMLLEAPPLSEKDARVIFDDILRKLEDAGLVDSGVLDLTDVTFGTTEHGQGTSEDTAPPVPEILDYRFRVRRKVGNLQLANSLVRVAVMRTGEVGSIRILRGNVGFQADATVERKVGNDDCAERFQREHPNAVIKKQGIGYFLPRKLADDARVEPQCYFAFVTQSIVDGITAYSRRQDVRYSLLDPAAEPELLGGPAATTASEEQRD